MLTFARVAQGLGGAALMSVNTALIRLIYPQRFLGRGMGVLLSLPSLRRQARLSPQRSSPSPHGNGCF